MVQISSMLKEMKLCAQQGWFGVYNVGNWFKWFGWFVREDSAHDAKMSFVSQWNFYELVRAQVWCKVGGYSIIKFV